MNAFTAIEQRVGAVLPPTLGIAVPLRIAELSRLPRGEHDKRCRRWAAEAAEAVAHYGDALMFPGRGRPARPPNPAKGDPYGLPAQPGTAEVFNAFAKGLAALAFAPGGVRFAGTHWAASRPAEQPPAGPLPEPPWERYSRPVRTVKLPEHDA